MCEKRFLAVKNQLYPPDEEEASIDDILNTPIKIYIPGDDTSTDAPVSLPTTPTNLSNEELKTLLKTKKPTCSGITASYSCGNHDSTPQYSGSIVAVNAGDEVAMNSLVISIVDIDGSGNGSGKIKIPMFNNAEVGVILSGIKVAEGGCIVAGRAELSGVDLALLNAQQRAKLDVAYSIFVQATDAVYNNAGAAAETYNYLSELLNGVKENAKKIVAKLTSGQNLSKTEKNKLEALNKNAKSKLEIALKTFDLQYPNTKDEFQLRRRQQIQKAISLLGNTTECLSSNVPENKPTEEIKKGPYLVHSTYTNPCTDSLSELADFDFPLLQDNLAFMDEEGKFAKEILEVTKLTLDVKNKSLDKKPETLDLKPNFDIHYAKMQAIANRFTEPKPVVDAKRYQVDNIKIELSGKKVNLKHFILGYEGDFTLNLNEFSEENITNNAQDKLLFVGAQASKKELMAIHGTKKDIKTVYDYLNPNKENLLESSSKKFSQVLHKLDAMRWLL